MRSPSSPTIKTLWNIPVECLKETWRDLNSPPPSWRAHPQWGPQRQPTPPPQRLQTEFPAFLPHCGRIWERGRQAHCQCSRPRAPGALPYPERGLRTPPVSCRYSWWAASTFRGNPGWWNHSEWSWSENRAEYRACYTKCRNPVMWNTSPTPKHVMHTSFHLIQDAETRRFHMPTVPRSVK